MAEGAESDAEKSIWQPFSARDYRGATEAFLRLYGSDVYRFFINQCTTRPDADDAFQEFSDRLWRKIDTFKGRNDDGASATFKTWGYVVANNVVRSLGRTNQRRRRRFELQSSIAGDAPAPRSATATFMKTESRRIAAELLGELPEEQRTLVQLRYLQGLSWEEVVAVVKRDGVSEVALRQRLSRAVKKLNRLAGERRRA